MSIFSSKFRNFVLVVLVIAFVWFWLTSDMIDFVLFTIATDALKAMLVILGLAPT